MLENGTLWDLSVISSSIAIVYHHLFTFSGRGGGRTGGSAKRGEQQFWIRRGWLWRTASKSQEQQTAREKESARSRAKTKILWDEGWGEFQSKLEKEASEVSAKYTLPWTHWYALLSYCGLYFDPLWHYCHSVAFWPRVALLFVCLRGCQTSSQTN